MIKIVKFATILVSIGYPFVLVFAPSLVAFFICALAIVWILKAWFEKSFYSGLLGVFFGIVLVLREFGYLYPVIINLSCFVLFFYSLKNEAIITKFARAKEGNLPENVILYTRKLTKIWCAFFVLNAFVSFVLIYVDKNIWAIYCGFISYVLIGALFGVEILYRKFVLLRGRDV